MFEVVHKSHVWGISNKAIAAEEREGFGRIYFQDHSPRTRSDGGAVVTSQWVNASLISRLSRLRPLSVDRGVGTGARYSRHPAPEWLR